MENPYRREHELEHAFEEVDNPYFEERTKGASYNEPLSPSIHCVASNCVHHDGKHSCCASKIDVGTKNACSSGETECASFVPRDRG